MGMNVKYLNRLFVIILLVAFSGCRKDEPHEMQLEWPESFKQLMDAYYSGKYFNSVEQNDDFTSVCFVDGSRLDIPNDDVKIIDCNLFDPPVIAEDAKTGTWTINLVRTGIPVDRSLGVNDSYPLCLWFDEDCLNIAMSNGESLTIGRDPSLSLTEFVFYAADNYGLNQGINCQIDGYDVTGLRPVSLNDFHLVPRFSYRGRSIKVDGEDQVSGKTKQDFSSPVRYDIELYSGQTVSFTVQLKLSGDFPLVIIHTNGGAPIRDRHTWVPGTIRIEDPKNQYSDVAVLTSKMNIHGRGNTSWTNFPKKPYRIKLDEKASVFGLPKNKDWVLLASYSDKTLLRDATAYEISRICGMKWTPTFHHVELYLNNVYQGVYLLGDNKEVAKHRVDIDVVTPSDNDGDAVTGGYYFEIEQQLDKPVSWSTSMGVPMMFVEPEQPTNEQITYVKRYFDQFEAAITSDNYASPTEGYAKYIDVDSFVNYYIVEELLKNIDGNLRKSTFLTKERGGKLEMYHIWDSDLTLGNCDYFNSMYNVSNSYTGFFIKDYGAQGYGSGWYYRIAKDPEFKKKVKARWNELKPQLSRVPDFIRKTSQELSDPAARNFQKWDILSTYVWPNARVTGSYDGEVSYLISFYANRLDWLDTQIAKW